MPRSNNSKRNVLLAITMAAAAAAYSMYWNLKLDLSYFENPSGIEAYFENPSRIKSSGNAYNDSDKTKPTAATTIDTNTKLNTYDNRNETKSTTITTTNTNTNHTTFQRHDGVVIALKIHGPTTRTWGEMEQSMCLLHFAYNHKMNYDIVVFTALEPPSDRVEYVRQLVAPAKITFVMDNRGFQEEVAALTPAKRDFFLRRCNVTDPSNLNWDSKCPDSLDKTVDAGTATLAYNWQAEFRSIRVWEHPALADYKTMLWMDSDGFATREWEQDPVDYFIRNKGVILFDNFPWGNVRDQQTLEAVLDAFNATVCGLEYDRDQNSFAQKRINRTQFDKCKKKPIPMIHGFFHVTDLDFYRQPKVLNGLKRLLGDCFLCRNPDDQLAVTIPAAIYAPRKAWDMRSHGIDLRVFHNFVIDGKDKNPIKPPGFIQYWAQLAAEGFPSAKKTCIIDQPGR